MSAPDDHLQLLIQNFNDNSAKKRRKFEEGATKDGDKTFKLIQWPKKKKSKRFESTLTAIQKGWKIF